MTLYLWCPRNWETLIDAFHFTCRDAASELGELDEWSFDQLTILKEKALSSFGAVYSWTTAEMSQAGSVIGQ